MRLLYRCINRDYSVDLGLLVLIYCPVHSLNSSIDTDLGLEPKFIWYQSVEAFVYCFYQWVLKCSVFIRRSSPNIFLYTPTTGSDSRRGARSHRGFSPENTTRELYRLTADSPWRITRSGKLSDLHFAILLLKMLTSVRIAYIPGSVSCWLLVGETKDRHQFKICTMHYLFNNNNQLLNFYIIYLFSVV